MLIQISILLTLLSPLIIRAEASTQHSNLSLQSLIQEIPAMMSKKMHIDASDNFQAVQNSTSENIRGLARAMQEQSARADANQLGIIKSIGTVVNATTVNIESILSSIREKSASTDSNLIDVIDAVESLSGESKLWRDNLAEAMTTVLNQTMSMIVDIERNNAQRLVDASVTQVNNSKIDLLRETLEHSNSIISIMKNSTSRIGIINKPTGFSEYNGRILLLPAALGGSPLSWKDSLQRCLNHGTEPFIPRTIEDFRYIQRVSAIVTHISGSGMWLPTSDSKSEGTIKWFDGSDASSTLKLFDWRASNGYPGDNNESQDCVNTWLNDFKLEFETCTSTKLWPMICELS